MSNTQPAGASAEFEAIAAQAMTLANKHTSTNWGAVALNAAVLPFLLTPIMSIEDKSQLKTTAIDDDWLAAVAGMPQVSKAGLSHLASALERKGWVSVEEAATFVEIEAASYEDDCRRIKAEQATKQPGAAMLLARAEQELPGAIQRFADGAKEFAQAAGGVVAFAAEKAMWAGKGLGTVASWMKELRTAPRR
jgi:hypothetical protein